MTARARKYHWSKKKWKEEITILPVSFPKKMDLLRGFDKELLSDVYFAPKPDFFDAPKLADTTLDEFWLWPSNLQTKIK